MAQHRANIGQHGANIRQHRPNLGQHRPNMGQHRPNIGSTWAQDVPNIGPTWPNLGPRCAPDSLTLLNTGPTKANIGVTYAPQTQVGRRPAVRRKPLNTSGAESSRSRTFIKACGAAFFNVSRMIPSPTRSLLSNSFAHKVSPPEFQQVENRQKPRCLGQHRPFQAKHHEAICFHTLTCVRPQQKLCSQMSTLCLHRACHQCSV